MQASDARMCTPVPTMRGSRRPTMSDSGPMTSWPSARPTNVPASVSCTADDGVFRSSAMAGSAGRYMSMVSGPRAMSAPSTRITRRRSRDVGSVVGADVLLSRVSVTCALVTDVFDAGATRRSAAQERILFPLLTTTSVSYATASDSPVSVSTSWLVRRSVGASSRAGT